MRAVFQGDSSTGWMLWYSTCIIPLSLGEKEGEEEWKQDSSLFLATIVHGLAARPIHRRSRVGHADRRITLRGPTFHYSVGQWYQNNQRYPDLWAISRGCPWAEMSRTELTPQKGFLTGSLGPRVNYTTQAICNTADEAGSEGSEG